MYIVRSETKARKGDTKSDEKYCSLFTALFRRAVSSEPIPETVSRNPHRNVCKNFFTSTNFLILNETLAEVL